MRSSTLTVSSGTARAFAVAGLRFTVESELRTKLLRLPPSFRPFECPEGPSALSVRVSSRDVLPAAEGRLLYDSGLHWRALASHRSTTFELVYPPTSSVYCRASLAKDFSKADVVLSESGWRNLSPSREGALEWDLPYPLDQLLLVPVLALHGTLLLHACGAILADRGLVFAGHSGDGKTTLAGLLSQENIPLLSDERVAIRSTETGATAFGTPWAGEGNIVSNDWRPLHRLFVLRQAPRHAVLRPRASLVPEVLARAIVPYFLPEVAERVFEAVSHLASNVPLRELQFARVPGLGSVLRAAA